MEMRLLALRHGETAWSRERRFAGSKDIPLTAEGRRQCAALAQALAGSGAAAVYASPLVRARESAEPLAAAGCSAHDRPVGTQPTPLAVQGVAAKDQAPATLEHGRANRHSAALWPNRKRRSGQWPEVVRNVNAPAPQHR